MYDCYIDVYIMEKVSSKLDLRGQYELETQAFLRVCFFPQRERGFMLSLNIGKFELKRHGLHKEHVRRCYLLWHGLTLPAFLRLPVTACI